MVSVSGGITEGLRFSAQDKVYCRGKLNGKYVEGDFFRYWNLTLLYGDRKPENKKEIVVSESLLKRMGYDKDISQCLVKTETYRIGRSSRKSRTDSASPQSTSPMTRKRPWPFPTESLS